MHDGPALEVLLRLKDDNGEQASPTEFMRAAERYRLMPHVDRWVVQTALAALGGGALRLPSENSLAINLSGQTLGDTQFLEFVVDCLDRTGVAPTQVCFEVTENSVITNIEHARRFIGVLHGMGCQFALDDFGRGLGSFSNLKNLTLDYLKIDGSFIRNLAPDTVNQAMVTAMIKLARTLNFRSLPSRSRMSGTRCRPQDGRRLRAGLPDRTAGAVAGELARGTVGNSPQQPRAAAPVAARRY